MATDNQEPRIHLKKRYSNLKKRYPGVQVDSFAVREVDGVDEEEAASAVKAKGGNANSLEELVRLSIVEVDGGPTMQPFLPMDRWNHKTRNMVLAAWKELNGWEDKPDFLASGEVSED